MTELACFNCARTDGVREYSFDLDLPKIAACGMCLRALAMNDADTLIDLRPRRRASRRQTSVGQDQLNSPSPSTRDVAQ